MSRGQRAGLNEAQRHVMTSGFGRLCNLKRQIRNVILFLFCLIGKNDFLFFFWLNEKRYIHKC